MEEDVMISSEEKAKVEQLTESINNLELKENHLKKVAKVKQGCFRGKFHIQFKQL